MSMRHPDPAIAARQRWMGVLSRARREELAGHEAALRAGAYEVLRAPETGMVMVRGRMGASGGPFNLGEMTVTRCTVRLADGRMGCSYIAGRDKRRAELAALADAHLQGGEAARWMETLIEPLAVAQDRRRAAREAETASTRVDFFTLVRGFQSTPVTGRQRHSEEVTPPECNYPPEGEGFKPE